MNAGIIIPNENITLMAEKEEPRFLKILLTDKDCLQDALSFGIISSENNQIGHFLGEKNNLLFAIIKTNFLKYNTLLTRSAMDSIVDLMRIGEDEEKASIKSYWDKIWNRHDGTKEDYAMLRDHMNERYLLLQFYQNIKLAEKIIKSNSGHGDLIKKYINDCNSIKNLEPDAYNVTMGIDEGMDEAMKFITEKRDNPSNDTSIKCGIDAIDNKLHGFIRPSYTVISGMINGGKTTFMMNMGLNMAKDGYNVVYISLEKDAKLFFRRTLACHALTDYNRIKTGGKGQWGLSDYWYGKLKEASDNLKKIKVNYHCLQFLQNTKLTKILSEVDKLHAKNKIDVLIVDYLQVIGTETTTAGRPDMDLANVHKRLMAYGRKNHLVMFTALQLKNSSSKEIRKQAEKATSENSAANVSVNTEDYGGSQMVIADADNALGLVLNHDKPPTKVFVSFSKARDDESRSTIILDFDGKIGRISDPEYGACRVQDVDKELYENKLSENELVSDDNLFNTVESIENKKEIKEIKNEEIKESESSKSSSSSFEKPEDLVKEKVIERKGKRMDLTETAAKNDDDDLFKV